jgi:hypothetical protein
MGPPQQARFLANQACSMTTVARFKIETDEAMQR